MEVNIPHPQSGKWAFASRPTLWQTPQRKKMHHQHWARIRTIHIQDSGVAETCQQLEEMCPQCPYARLYSMAGLRGCPPYWQLSRNLPG